MSILGQLKRAVGLPDETETTYNCRECHRTFESTGSYREEVKCPKCGSSNTRKVVD